MRFEFACFCARKFKACLKTDKIKVEFIKKFSNKILMFYYEIIHIAYKFNNFIIFEINSHNFHL